MGSGGNSRAGQAHHPGKPLAEVGIVHHFNLAVTRISDTELSFRIDWSYRNSGPPAENPILGTSTYSFASYDETSGVIDGEPDAATSDIWANSKLTQFNGFGIMLHDDDPFDQDDDDGTFDQGTIQISNFAVEYLTVEHPPFGITEITYGAESNTVRWQALDGATYSVWTSTDLSSWLELEDSVVATGDFGEYTHEMPAASARRYYQVRWDPRGQ